MAGLDLSPVTPVAEPPVEMGAGKVKPAPSFLFLAGALAGGNVLSSLLARDRRNPPGSIHRPRRPRAVQQHRTGPGLRAISATWRLERIEPGTAVLCRQRRSRAGGGTCRGGPGLGPGPECGAWCGGAGPGDLVPGTRQFRTCRRLGDQRSLRLLPVLRNDIPPGDVSHGPRLRPIGHGQRRAERRGPGPGGAGGPAEFLRPLFEGRDLRGRRARSCCITGGRSAWRPSGTLPIGSTCWWSAPDLRGGATLCLVDSARFDPGAVLHGRDREWACMRWS